jgi:hypothetical protein
MGKMDISARIKQGIQPGIMPMKPMMNNNAQAPKNNLLSPSFESVMNKMPNANDATQKRAIGTKPSLMNKFNGR